MSKEYIKKTLDNCARKFRNNLSHQHKNLRSKNPKDYWKILNSPNKNKKYGVDINEMYTFMNDINKTDSEELTHSNLYTSLVRNNNQTLSDDLLNMPIQEEEIREAVKKLKKGKAPGNDHILNEHIATTLHLFMLMYLNLFNIIYESGIVPGDCLSVLLNQFIKIKVTQ